MARTLNIIGSGHVGTTLGLLFGRHGTRINDVVARHAASAEQAVARLGQGRALGGTDALTPADITVVTTPDDSIAPVAAQLARTLPPHPGALFFHCSGATSADALAPLRAQGGTIASLHPLKTFTDPRADADSFAGTFCALDGDADACARLRVRFEAFGADCVEINGEDKLLYHAGAVFISNYLHALVEAGLRCYDSAGIDRADAARAVRPLLEATVRNTLQNGPAAALTGPIARGDVQLVRRQQDALHRTDPTLADLYAALGRVTVEIAHEKGNAPEAALDAIKTALSDGT